MQRIVQYIPYAFLRMAKCTNKEQASIESIYISSRNVSSDMSVKPSYEVNHMKSILPMVFKLFQKRLAVWIANI